MKKKKAPPRTPVQLHIDPTPVEPTEAFTLEDIMNEFGGWSRRPELPAPPLKAAEAEKTAEPPAATPETHEPPNAGQTEAERVRVAEVAEKTGQMQKEQPDLSADTMRFAPIREDPPVPPAPKIWAYRGEAVPGSESPDARVRLTREEQRARERRRRAELRAQKRQARRERRREQPERTFASPEEAYRFYCQPDSLRLRLLLSLLFTLLSVALLVLTSGLFPQTTGYETLCSWGMLGAMALSAVLALDVLADGARAVLRLKFDLQSLLLLLLLLVSADAVLALLEGRVPLCAVVSLELTVALWSRSLAKTAKYKTMKAVCTMPTPVAAVRGRGAWQEMDCIFRAPGDRDAFTRQLEMPDAAGRIGRVYAPVMAGLTLLLSAMACLQTRQSLPTVWAAMLLAAYPAGLCLACARSFSRVAARLYRSGAALAGWYGTRQFSNDCAMIITDSDLFPAKNVTLNGMKLYSDRSASQIIGFASALVQTAGSGLVPLFEEMMHSQNGRHYRVDTFRRYEGGGLGAEIQGDVILMGSMGFMRLMKVQIPEGTRLKQAVYLSVNGELAAVFALNYAPHAGIAGALHTLVHTAGVLPLLATRDFMITPQFLKLRYKIPSDRVEFPTVEERARLSEPSAAQDGTQGALLVRNSFEAVSAVVAGARGMRGAAIGCIVIAVMGGVMGTLVMCFLASLGAMRSASCWNLFLYTLLWLLPEILVTGLPARR